MTVAPARVIGTTGRTVDAVGCMIDRRAAVSAGGWQSRTTADVGRDRTARGDVLVRCERRPGCHGLTWSHSHAATAVVAATAMKAAATAVKTATTHVAAASVTSATPVAAAVAKRHHGAQDQKDDRD